MRHDQSAHTGGTESPVSEPIHNRGSGICGDDDSASPAKQSVVARLGKLTPHDSLIVAVPDLQKVRAPSAMTRPASGRDSSTVAFGIKALAATAMTCPGGTSGTHAALPTYAVTTISSCRSSTLT